MLLPQRNKEFRLDEKKLQGKLFGNSPKLYLNKNNSMRLILIYRFPYSLKLYMD